MSQSCPAPWTLENSSLPPPGWVNSLEGISPRWPPLPGKALKAVLFYFIQNSPHFYSALVNRGWFLATKSFWLIHNLAGTLCYWYSFISCFSYIISSVQFSRSVVSDSATPWTAAHQASLSITNSWSLLKLMSIESVMPSNHLILCHPLLLLPSMFPSIRVFSKESVLRIRWPKYWSFSFSISPSNEYSGLSSFRMDWLDLLAVQEPLKSLLQHHSSKALVLWHSAFFIV